jgi:hypothetical protein
MLKVATPALAPVEMLRSSTCSKARIGFDSNELGYGAKLISSFKHFNAAE